MQPATHIDKSFAVAFDADVLAEPHKQYFEEDYWRGQNAVTGTAKGRGNSWFVEAPFGDVVLRRYYRGGWVARISRDRYFYMGVIHSRPFQEFAVLVSLLKLGLPVPTPVAAICEHKGLFYRGALLTQVIENTRTLADFLPKSNGNEADSDEAINHQSSSQTAVCDEAANKKGEGSSTVWKNTGRCIRRFHAAGLWHADLNARNILIDADHKVYLIDFDRARLNPGKPVDGQNNLARLKRSLLKINEQNPVEHISEAWAHLMEGYHD